MEYIKLTEEELSSQIVGVGITVGSVMAIATAVIALIVVIKLFSSNKGGVTAPGGWKFSWD